jgi:tyrosine-protein kinase Etk/Wzc
VSHTIENLELKPEPAKTNWSLFDSLSVLGLHKRLIAFCTLALAVLGFVIGLILPRTYVAETKIVPPQQPQSMSSLMLGSLGPLGALSGKDLLKDKTEQFIGILKSRTVEDALVDRFDLQKVYESKYKQDARKKLERLSEIAAGKNMLISVRVEDRDPKRAADLANGYIEELYRANQRLAMSEASARRLFYEGELQEAKNNLATAEVEMRKTQEKTGLIQLDSQARAIIENVANMRAQIAAREIRLRTMQSFATAENPEIIQLQQELAAARGQLRALEQEQGAEPNVLVATGKVPAAGLEYIRRYRDVRYFETVFELISKQYEAARLDQAQSAPQIQVVDVAIPPERPEPLRMMLLVLFTLIGFFGCIAFVLGRERYRDLSKDVLWVERFHRLKKAWL